jgi:hypothetical protein
MAISCVIILLIHCLFLAVLMLASQVFFKGQMEYTIRIRGINVGEQIFYSWSAPQNAGAFLSVLILKGLNRC